MADTSVGAGISADWNQQTNKLINNDWEHKGALDITQYEVNDIVTYLDEIYQCILQSDASVNALRIPTNVTYWKPIGGTGDTGPTGATGVGIKEITKSGITITVTYTDDTSDTFTVTNGDNGAAGVGISSITKSGTTVTVTYTNSNTDTFTVPNGTPGLNGLQGGQGIQGIQGPPGVKGDQGPDGPDWFTFIVGKQDNTLLTDTTTEKTYSFSYNIITYYRKKLKTSKSDKIYSDSDFTTELASRY